MLRLSTFLRDLKSIRVALLISLLLFVVGVALGWISTGTLKEIINQQMSGLSNVANGLRESEHPRWSFFVFIFLNNSIKGIIIMYLGILVGFLPVFFLLINGMVIGYLVHSVSMQGESLFDLIVKGLLPHGIIEIPAIIIACAFGLQLGIQAITSIGAIGSEERRRVQAIKWRQLFRQSITAGFWIVILLLIAAVIESTLTFALMQN
ncbi:stage II sporulation protein M [Paenibacillus pini]|uniref:Stage II sporulation protein M n=1 Tax=Paenibacillus pini JCM 16418 TaxID=1236976 RepID=W7Z009_9BACL|nr:stage II sporulation protein M [Paenibacillus pini]GAF10286.1 hypothetical protein JCM16418_4465 [Paenibacillus pini JCM 16418]